MVMCLIHSLSDLFMCMIEQKPAVFKRNKSPEQELLILVNIL